MRAVHYYDQVGLVCPSVRTSGGHRLYTEGDVRRLCAVALLRMAGQSTAEISEHLASSDWDLSKIIENQLVRLDQQLTTLGTLRHRLAEAASADRVAVGEPDFLARLQRTLATPYAAHKAVALLAYLDVDEARRWLGEVFGLPAGPTEQDVDGNRYASVVTGQGLVLLHQAAEGFQPPATAGICTAMIVVSVDNVDHLAEQITAKGGRITHGPTDMVYGVRELGATDLAGHLWCFHQTLSKTGEQP